MKIELFEWDEQKNLSNRERHGIAFEEAKEVFYGLVFTSEDARRSYGEVRFISIGSIQSHVVIVIAHTSRNQKIRIISARKANKEERKIYYGYIKEAIKRNSGH